MPGIEGKITPDFRKLRILIFLELEGLLPMGRRN